MRRRRGQRDRPRFAGPLARGTPRVRWTLTTPSTTPTSASPSPRRFSDKDFDDFIDLVLPRWRRIDDAAVKERLFANHRRRTRIVVPLLKRLSSSKDDERAAVALLKRATGLDNGYDPSAKPDARDAAVAAWQT